MKSKKQITILSSITVLAVIGSFIYGGSKILSVSGAGTCSHEGNHYNRVEPTETTSGHKEFWACCKCRTQFLEKPSTGNFVNALDITMTGGLSSTHIAYLPQITPEYKYSPLKEPMMANQVYLNTLGDIYSVWEKYRGDGVTLAVIDSGFDYNHPEFKVDGVSKLSSKSAYFYTNNGTTNKVVGVNNVGITDGDSHGTFCATVAAARANNTGTVGIAPNCDLMLLKVDKKPASINAAFRYAADNGAKVITISIGSYASGYGDLDMTGFNGNLATAFDSAVKYAYDKGVVICSAAGNGGESSNPTEKTYPGATPNIIGCGGTAYNNENYCWSGSSYNRNASDVFCDIFAPAENLYSGCSYDGKKYDGGWNGTSFASPIVAGAAALYFNKYPSKTNVDFERDLYNTAISMEDSHNTGHGRIDIGALLDETNKGKVQLSFAPNSEWSKDNSKTTAYMWGTRGNASTAITVVPNQTFEVDLSLYDKIEFVRESQKGEFWGSRVVQLSLYAFSYAKGYKMNTNTDIWYNNDVKNAQVGLYTF